MVKKLVNDEIRKSAFYEFSKNNLYHILIGHDSSTGIPSFYTKLAHQQGDFIHEFALLGEGTNLSRPVEKERVLCMPNPKPITITNYSIKENEIELVLDERIFTHHPLSVFRISHINPKSDEYKSLIRRFRQHGYPAKSNC